MKIGIIGGGSIGLLLGSYLGDRHHVTVYVRRKEQRDKLNAYGIKRDDMAESVSVRAALVSQIAAEDLLIVCVKQPQLSGVLRPVHAQEPAVPIIFLQNGMGHVPYLKKINRPVLLGVVEHGAYRENDYSVTHTGKGVIRLASFNDSLLKEVAEQLSGPGFPISTVSDWELLLKEKLIINAVINPLTALFGIRNGEILTNDHIRDLAVRLCNEASNVLNLDSAEQWDRVQMVARNTQENISSMLADIREGRQTEVNAISGYLLNLKSDSIPYTVFVYHSIKALEVKKGLLNKDDEYYK